MMQTPEVAYYHRAPFWRSAEGDWIKTLLLFFDQVAILLPSYMYGRHTAADPTLAEPLEERGLLQILDPADWVDETMVEQLAEMMVGLLEAGAFDGLATDCRFAELSNARMGYHVDVRLADMLVGKLKERDLARPSKDGVSVPLHPVVRKTVLVILGQLSRPAGNRRGMAIHPVTNRPSDISDLVDVLERDSMPSASRVVELDVEPVALDLSLVPLDEVLEFREEHQVGYRAYMRDLHGFLYELALVDDPVSREAAFVQRREEIADAARALQRDTRSAFGLKLAARGLGIAGAAWSIANNDPSGLIFKAAGVALRAAGHAIKPKAEVVAAYSYIFDIKSNFGTAS